MSSVVWTDEKQNLSNTKVALKEREVDFKKIEKQPEEIAIQTNQFSTNHIKIKVSFTNYNPD